MEIGLFDSIAKSIEAIGLGYTLVGLVVTMGIGWVYRNQKKEKQVLAETVQAQNQTIMNGIDSQNEILYEIQRVNINMVEIIKELSGKVDGAMAIVVTLVQRDLNRDDKGGK
jgi:hypothetical protein